MANERLNIIKDACENHNSVYLLVHNKSMRAIKMAWGTLDQAKEFFIKEAGLDENLEGFFITKVIKSTL